MANRPPTLDPNVMTIRDLEAAAEKILPKDVREYFKEGAMDLISLQDNVAAFDRYRILPRTLRNVSNLDISTTLFGCKIAFPLSLSPSANHKLAHPLGEIATSRAAASTNVGMCLSSYSNTPLEDVIAQGSGNPYMIQMCVVRDRSLTKQLLERAEAAGYKALFLSVDVPCLGRRLNEHRNNFTLPDHLGFPNILSSQLKECDEGADSHDYDASLEWDEIIPWLRQNTNMQIWLKGILSPDDVQLAIEAKVDGVIISNHGGRQLDGVPAALDALRECARVARGRIGIGIDGGVRRGSDIFKAIALGAQHVFIGRIVVWGLAYKGEEGVELAIKTLLEEFKITMRLAGCRTLSDITPQYLTFQGPGGCLAKLASSGVQGMLTEECCPYEWPLITGGHKVATQDLAIAPIEV